MANDSGNYKRETRIYGKDGSVTTYTVGETRTYEKDGIVYSQGSGGMSYSPPPEEDHMFGYIKGAGNPGITQQVNREHHQETKSGRQFGVSSEPDKGNGTTKKDKKGTTERDGKGTTKKDAKSTTKKH